MNLFDLVVVILLIVAVIVGFGSGALPQLAGLIGALLGGALTILLLPVVGAPLAALDPGPRALVVLAGILFAVGTGEAIGSALGRSAAIRLGQGILGATDRVMGALVGVGQALLVVWLVGGLLAASPLRTLAAQAQTSTVVRGLAAILPPPTEIAAELSRLLDHTPLPELFIGLEPLPAPPVALPDDPQARAIAAIAVPSTVKISAATCELQSTGTGFVVARGYVVTNAHVIAGARAIRVGLGERLYDAVPVFLDPAIDIAVLWVARLEAAPLRLAAIDPQRGAEGATLGYPGAGTLRVGPAAVAGAYAAQGRDIYGRERVTRQILELRAEVDQGDSGGPLVLADGSVGGVVFAEARTDDEVGYALTASSVAVAIQPAIGRTGPVETGACIR